LPRGSLAFRRDGLACRAVARSAFGEPSISARLCATAQLSLPLLCFERRLGPARIADGTSFIAWPLSFSPNYDMQCPVYALKQLNFVEKLAEFCVEETGRILLNNLHLMNRICTPWISCAERAQQNVCGKKAG
jgi:hypothetical protein